MSQRRLSTARIAGIAAWTAASVTWGTAAVAVASRPAEASAAEAVDEPVVLPLPVATTSTIPAMPENGLVILRYTPVDRPAPRVVTEVRVAPGGSTATAPTPTPAPVTRRPVTRSSGS